MVTSMMLAVALSTGAYPVNYTQAPLVRGVVQYHIVQTAPSPVVVGAPMAQPVYTSVVGSAYQPTVSGTFVQAAPSPVVIGTPMAQPVYTNVVGSAYQPTVPGPVIAQPVYTAVAAPVVAPAPVYQPAPSYTPAPYYGAPMRAYSAPANFSFGRSSGSCPNCR